MNKISCALSNVHLLNDGKILPCLNQCCLRCLKMAAPNGLLACVCNQDHPVRNPDQLLNVDVDKIINEETNLLVTEMSNEFNMSLDKVKDLCDSREELTRNYFEFMQEDIIIRIESMKNHLDELGNQFIDKLNSIRTHVEQRLNSFNDHITSKLESWTTCVKEMNENLNSLTKEQSLIKDRLYKCKEYLAEINEYERDFYSILRSVTFQSSDQMMPDELYIGKMRSPAFDLTRLNTFDPAPNSINCRDALIAPIYICELKSCDDELAVLSHRRSGITIVNKKFEVLNRLPKIGDLAIDNPQAICTNNAENVYLVMANQLVIFNKDLTAVQSIHGEYGHGPEQFNRPSDILFFNENIYVLDTGNSRLKILSQNGEFLSEMFLMKSDNKRLDCPFRMAINKDMIAIVDSEDKIYIYTHEGKLMHTIEHELIHTICFVGSYLFAHSSNGFFVCYDAENNCNKYQLKAVFRRHIQSFTHFSYCMFYMHGDLVISFANKRCVVFITLEKSFKIDYLKN